MGAFLSGLGVTLFFSFVFLASLVVFFPSRLSLSAREGSRSMTSSLGTELAGGLVRSGANILPDANTLPSVGEVGDG